MRVLTVANSAAFALALLLSTAVAWVPGCWGRTATARSAPEIERGAPSAPGTRGPGLSGRTFRRIVSGSALADALLIELCEPDRIAAFTEYGLRQDVGGYRYAGKPTIQNLEDVEAILALHPDLVLVHGTADRRPLDRLREAGIIIHDLGVRRGLATLVSNIHEVAELLGHPERGDRLARAIVEQMHAVAIDVPTAARRSALYLSAYGDRLFGGASGTSFHDVLTAAGLQDAASGYRDWPEYSAEQILVADPDVIVTNTNMRDRICGSAGLETLRACKRAGGVVEIDDALLGNPGPAMVEAARAIRTAVYGSDFK